MNDKNTVVFFKWIIISFILSRLLFYIIGAFAENDWNIIHVICKYNTWDAGWYYRYVSGLGKDLDLFSIRTEIGEGVWAFFPFYPLLVRIVCDILHILSVEGIFVIGSLLSSCFFCISEYVACKYIMLTRNSKKYAYLYILFMSFGIYSFYFSITYTEALFLMLLSCCFFFLEKENYIAMGICGALLSATRNVGVMFVCVVLLKCIINYVSAEEKKSILLFLKKHITNGKLLLGTCLIPSGLFVYMFCLYRSLGDGFAFVHVQKGWYKDNLGLAKSLISSLVSRFPGEYWGFSTFVVIIIIILMLCKKNYVEAVFPIIVLLIASASSLSSMPRYMIGSFGITLGFLDEYIEWEKTYQIMIGLILFGMELVMVYHWVIGNGYLL